MKQLIFYFALLVSFCSCSKDESSIQDQIIGKWLPVQVRTKTSYPDGKILLDTFNYVHFNDYYDFKNDGNLYSFESSELDTIPYTLFERNIILDGDTFGIVKLTSNELELHDKSFLNLDFPSNGEIEVWWNMIK